MGVRREQSRPIDMSIRQLRGPRSRGPPVTGSLIGLGGGRRDKGGVMMRAVLSRRHFLSSWVTHTLTDVSRTQGMSHSHSPYMCLSWNGFAPLVMPGATRLLPVPLTSLSCRVYHTRGECKHTLLSAFTATRRVLELRTIQRRK